MKVSVIQMNMRSLESKANFDRAEALVRRAVGENGPDVVVLPETWNTGFMPAGDLAAACDENAKAVRARFSPARARAERQHRRGKRVESPQWQDLQYRLRLRPRGRVHLRIRQDPSLHADGRARGLHPRRPPRHLHARRRALRPSHLLRGALSRAVAHAGAARSAGHVPARPVDGGAPNTTGKRSPPPARSKTSSLSSRATPAASATARCMAVFSRIIDPLGAVLAQGGGEEEIVTADLDLSSIAPLRARVPVFHDRRPALYRL